jgi:hypothetical protein
MVRALGLEPRTNALKGVFYSLQEVATVCIERYKPNIYSTIEAQSGTDRCTESQGIPEKSITWNVCSDRSLMSFS